MTEKEKLVKVITSMRDNEIQGVKLFEEVGDEVMKSKLIGYVCAYNQILCLLKNARIVEAFCEIYGIKD